MNTLNLLYQKFLDQSKGRDSSGFFTVQMGGGVEEPPPSAVPSLSAALRVAYNRQMWVIRIEVGLIVLFFATSLVIISALRGSANAELGAAGVNAASIMTILTHLHKLWKDITEIEIVLGMADNLPPKDLLRFIEMRSVQRTQRGNPRNVPRGNAG